MARLKVFAWSNGLKTYAVATTSRPKALEAWGIRQDLFADGTAHEVEDPALVAVATAQPGVVVEQAVGGGAAKAIAAIKPPPKPKGPTAAEKRVTDLKAQLDRLEDAHRLALDALEDRRRALDAEIENLRRAQEDDRTALAEKLRAARTRV